MLNKEYILCSSIWYKDLPTQNNLPINCNKGIIVCGYRHHNIIHSVLSLTGLRTVKNGEKSVGDYVQGFLTSKNRFVDRVEASRIAYEYGQIETMKKYLFSEDIW